MLIRYSTLYTQCACSYLSFLAECMFTDFEFMKTFTKAIKSVFPVVRYAYGIYTPGYIGGQCGFMVASKDKVWANHPVLTISVLILRIKYWRSRFIK